jgi:hypothetical protein
MIFVPRQRIPDEFSHFCTAIAPPRTRPHALIPPTEIRIATSLPFEQLLPSGPWLRLRLRILIPPVDYPPLTAPNTLALGRAPDFNLPSK